MSFSTKNKKTVKYVTEEKFNKEIKNLVNATIHRSDINNCSITNPEKIQFITYKNLEEANNNIKNNDLGELVYIKDTNSLYQLDKKYSGLFYNKLVKSEEFDFYVIAKCVDTSGQAFYDKKEQNILFSHLELDNQDIVDLDTCQITIKNSGIYSINSSFIIEAVKNADSVKKFGFYKDKKFIDITNCFLKSDGYGYLSGSFEGYLEKGTKIKLVLEVECSKFLYLSHKPGVNYISLRSLKIGDFNN